MLSQLGMIYETYVWTRRTVVACVGLFLGAALHSPASEQKTVIEEQLNRRGVAVVEDIKKPVREIQIQGRLADVVTLKSWEWEKAGIEMDVTTTAYPYYDGGDNRTCDNRLVQPTDYTFAVSRDLENIRLKSGRVINLREKIRDPRGSNQMVYRWRAFIPGYSKAMADGTPIWSTLAVPRDRMPKTVWVNAKGAKKFRYYHFWRRNGLFLDARQKPGKAREVRVATRMWVDVMYTHKGSYGSIEARCHGEWGRIHPDHAVRITLYELKPKFERVLREEGEVCEL